MSLEREERWGVARIGASCCGGSAKRIWRTTRRMIREIAILEEIVQKSLFRGSSRLPDTKAPSSSIMEGKEEARNEKNGVTLSSSVAAEEIGAVTLSSSLDLGRHPCVESVTHIATEHSKKYVLLVAPAPREQTSHSSDAFSDLRAVPSLLGRRRPPTGCASSPRTNVAQTHSPIYEPFHLYWVGGEHLPVAPAPRGQRSHSSDAFYWLRQLPENKSRTTPTGCASSPRTKVAQHLPVAPAPRGQRSHSSDAFSDLRAVPSLLGRRRPSP